MINSWPTPFVQLPRRMPFNCPDGGLRARLVVFAAFAFIPTALFWTWYVVEAYEFTSSQSIVGLRPAMVVSSLWLLLGPLLMQQGEYNLERLLAKFNAPGGSADYDAHRISLSLARVDQLFYLTVLGGLAAAAALWFAFPNLETVIPIVGIWRRMAGLIVALFVGFVSASGIWGVAKALTLVVSATRCHSGLWWPFGTHTSVSLEALQAFAWKTGIIFSVGSTFLPPLFVVRDSLPLVSEGVVTAFAFLLFAGGFLIFSVPAAILYKLGQRLQDYALAQLDPVFRRVTPMIANIDQRPLHVVTHLHLVVTSATAFRLALQAEDPSPLSTRTLARAATTLALPILLTAWQVVSTS